MSKREKISFYDLSRQERIVLSAVSEAMRQKDRSISVDIGKKRCYVSVHPWSEERTGHWTETEPGFYECSACRNTQIDKTDFCPDCGARMEVSGNEQG